MSEKNSSPPSGLTDSRRVAEEIQRIFPTINHVTVFSTAYRLTGEVAGAEDIQQRFYLALLCMSESRRAEIKSIDAYAWISLRNLAAKWRQDHRPINHDPLDIAVPLEDEGADFTTRIADEDEINFLLNQIPEKCREAFVCFNAVDCTAKEVAKQLRLTENAVKARLRLATIHLAKARKSYLDGMIDSTSHKTSPTTLFTRKEHPDGKR